MKKSKFFALFAAVATFALTFISCDLLNNILDATTDTGAADEGSKKDEDSDDDNILSQYLDPDHTMLRWAFIEFFSWQKDANANEACYITGQRMCSINGISYWYTVYKGEHETVRHNSTDEVTAIKTPKTDYFGNIKVTKKAVAGDALNPTDYFYIFSQPDDSTPENTLGMIHVGDMLGIVDENYSSEWAQIKLYYSPKYIDAVGYIRKENINYEDSYLIGTAYNYRKYIKLAKDVGITYDESEKDYSKPLTRQEFAQLAVHWLKATGYVQQGQDGNAVLKSITGEDFSSDEEIADDDAYYALLRKLADITENPDTVYAAAKVGLPSYDTDGRNPFMIYKDQAIYGFYRAYVVLQDKDYLVPILPYTIYPADSQDVCIDVWKSKTVKTDIGLETCNGTKSQKFSISYYKDNYYLDSEYSYYTLTGNSDNVFTDEKKELPEQKVTFEYNDDGTVCIKNGYGKYLDIQGGKTVRAAHLMYAKKSGKSSQKFIFKYEPELQE